MADNIWISAKVGAITLTIGGTDPATFQDNIISVLGPESPDTIGELFTAAFLSGAETALHAQAADAVIAAGMAAPNPGSNARREAEHDTPRQASAAPQAQPPAAATSEAREETDKFGRRFTYAVPGAPSCPHGPRVKMNATSKNTGKAYEAWVCPTTTPFAYRQKIQKQDCPMEFANSR